ncbi:MAG: hypothetical protein ACJAS3_003684 [Roseivirga sp.]|jgi:hypothetical protein
MSLIAESGILFFLFLVGAPVLLWIIALVDCLKSDFEKEGKIVWILVIVFLPILGSLLYLIIGRGQKLSTRDQSIKS